MKNLKLIGLTSIFLLAFSSLFAQLEWVPYKGEVPENAVIGGIETQRALPVCRCNFNGAMHPGKVVDKYCNIGYGGAEKVISDFEILINKGGIALDWEKSSGQLPANAVQAGTEGSLALYVGRSHYKEGTHPGKVFKSGNYICNIGWGGKEITQTTFEVLVEHRLEVIDFESQKSRCAENNYSSIAKTLGSIKKDQTIEEGFSLISNNLKYATRVTDDGRLVVEEVQDMAICDDGRIIIFSANELWSNTPNKGDASKKYFMKFQEDGNLCIYHGKDSFVWCSMSNGKKGHHFEITNIGHIEVVNDHGVEVWPD